MEAGSSHPGAPIVSAFKQSFFNQYPKYIAFAVQIGILTGLWILVFVSLNEREEVILWLLITITAPLIMRLTQWVWLDFSPLSPARVRVLPLIVVLLICSFLEFGFWTFFTGHAILRWSLDTITPISIFFAIQSVGFFAPPILLLGLERLGFRSARQIRNRWVFFLAEPQGVKAHGLSEELEELHWLVELSSRLPGIPPVQATVVGNLHVRARKLNRMNGLLLLLIVAVLMAAAFIIVYAGQIAGKDTESLDSVQTLRKMVDEQESAMRSLEDKEFELSSGMIGAKSKLNSAAAAPKELAEAAALFQTAEAELEIVQARMKRAVLDSDRLRSLLDKTQEAAFTHAPDGAGSVGAVKLLVAAGVTRFGILLLVIYLVQILVGLYRYNAKVSAHYVSEADALLLLDKSPKVIADLLNAMAPQVNFDKAALTLPQQAMESISNIIRASIAQSFGGAKESIKGIKRVTGKSKKVSSGDKSSIATVS
jgi:hypothetical protein